MNQRGSGTPIMLNNQQLMPLAGQRILVTRAREQAEAFVRQIVSLGGEAICFPLLMIRPPQEPSVIDDVRAALHQLSSFDWIVFTSVNGVHYFFEWLQRFSDNDGLPESVKVIAVGPETARALQLRGIEAVYPPKEYQQEGIVELLTPILKSGERVLLPTAALTRVHLRSALSKQGIEVTQITVYENVYNDVQDHSSGTTDMNVENGHAYEDKEAAGMMYTGAEVLELLCSDQIHIIPFTSSSSVTHLLEFLERQGVTQPQQLLNRFTLVCIGSVTANTALDAGLVVKRVAERATIPYLVRAMVDCCIDNNA